VTAPIGGSRRASLRTRARHRTATRVAALIAPTDEPTADPAPPAAPTDTPADEPLDVKGALLALLPFAELLLVVGFLVWLLRRPARRLWERHSSRS
jgi:hypothetical protein